MSNTIVVGYDGTEGSRSALEGAITFARDLGGSVHLVFAFQASRLGTESADLDAAIAERARTALEHGEHQAAALDFPVTTEVRTINTAEALIEVADERDARMIVVGSYGERPLKSALVGSTPTRLLHLSERPVLVVRAPE